MTPYEPEFEEIWNKVSKYTQGTKTKLYLLYKCTKYIINNDIKGDFVEAGVWKGGCCMLIGYLLKKYKKQNRIFLIDTFNGMTKPTKFDFTDYLSNAEVFDKWQFDDTWNYYPYYAVKLNMQSTKYDNFHYILGDISFANISKIKNICLLRIDVDFYTPTKATLRKLYPKTRKNGIIIFDDYNEYYGCNKAVDEYFKGKKFLIDCFQSTILIK